MQLKDQVVVVTGGADGIGRALCRRFAAEGARGVVVADMDESKARNVAAKIGGLAVAVDVASEADIKRLVDRATKEYGPIDLFCSNAGICLTGDATFPDEQWQRIWRSCPFCGIPANLSRFQDQCLAICESCATRLALDFG